MGRARDCAYRLSMVWSAPWKYERPADLFTITTRHTGSWPCSSILWSASVLSFPQLYDMANFIKHLRYYFSLKSVYHFILSSLSLLSVTFHFSYELKKAVINYISNTLIFIKSNQAKPDTAPASGCFCQRLPHHRMAIFPEGFALQEDAGAFRSVWQTDPCG